ncbi:MAG: hypothetical protein JWQ87_2842 [Candidatus Sulfotelmatobacter sp.]|nr:hypothetical protein [Candidatus Sulfotelmatobacter sp.]
MFSAGLLPDGTSDLCRSDLIPRVGVANDNRDLPVLKKSAGCMIGAIPHTGARNVIQNAFYEYCRRHSYQAL